MFPSFPAPPAASAPAKAVQTTRATRRSRVGVFGVAFVGAMLFASTAEAQLSEEDRQRELQKCEQEQRSCPAYTRPISPAPANNPDPTPRVAQVVVTTVAPPTAAVAGVTVTTAASTTAAPIVNVTPTAAVLGVTIEEQAEDVAFTGSESGRSTAAGLALTTVGASLIAVSRRRRRRA